MDKFTVNIHLTRLSQGDYPLLDTNEVLLTLAEQFADLTKRHDTRIKFPLKMKLDDPELGYSGSVFAGMVNEVDLSRLSKLELIALVLRLQGDGPTLRRMSDEELSALVLERARAKAKKRKSK